MRTALLIVLAAGALLPSCAQLYSEEQVADLRQEWESSLEALKRYQAELEAENATLRSQVEDLQVELNRERAANAREAVAALDADFEALRKRLEESMGGDGDLQYLVGPDGPVVRISEHVLFPSGSAEVSEEGRRLLTHLAGSLAENGSHFRVEGHTDDRPVRVHADRFPHGNLQLSAERAVSVAAILVEAGLPEEQISVVGYGPWRPVADNGTDEGRARNRRVEIVVVTAPERDGR
ncbi:MAG: OmpA family protein [Planctomycetota bacterium]|nr:MAG: OmpA family protein [Planctomycetota bacterium]